MESSKGTAFQLALVLTVVAGFALAGPATANAAAAETGCRGHVGYVTPIEYYCEGDDCQTLYLAGALQSGCATGTQP